MNVNKESVNTRKIERMFLVPTTPSFESDRYWKHSLDLSTVFLKRFEKKYEFRYIKK